MPPFFSYVKCSFQPEGEKLYYGRSHVEVVFAKTENLDYAMLKKWVSAEELNRSSMFHFLDDRCTYICCHAVLRLLLARRLNKTAASIVFERGYHNKPYLPGNPFYFNISHTRKSFAIAISDAYTGIDLESPDRLIKPELIMDSTFCMEEQFFINENEREEKERLLLLWTRKEAFLKAIGRGITSELSKIKVSEPHNLIAGSIIPTAIDIKISEEHYIYSINVSDHLLSVACPGEADLKLNIIDENNYVCKLAGLIDSDQRSAIAGYNNNYPLIR